MLYRTGPVPGFGLVGRNQAAIGIAGFQADAVMCLQQLSCPGSRST